MPEFMFPSKITVNKLDCEKTKKLKRKNVLENTTVKLHFPQTPFYLQLGFIVAVLIIITTLFSLTADEEDPWLWQWVGKFSMFLYYDLVFAYWQESVLMVLNFALLVLIIKRGLGHRREAKQLRRQIQLATLGFKRERIKSQMETEDAEVEIEREENYEKKYMGTAI